MHLSNGHVPSQKSRFESLQISCCFAIFTFTMAATRRKANFDTRVAEDAPSKHVPSVSAGPDADEDDEEEEWGLPQLQSFAKWASSFVHRSLLIRYNQSGPVQHVRQ